MVQFIIKRDVLGHFRFSSLQSAYAEQLLIQKGISTTSKDTIYLQLGDELLSKSEAAIYILSHLPCWRWSKVLYIFPKKLRDGVYDLIAKNRYRVFGKREQCMLPSADVSQRFID